MGMRLSRVGAPTLITLAAAVVVFASCSDSTGPSGLRLSSGPNLTMEAGTFTTLRVRSPVGIAAGDAGGAITWHSSNPRVVSVNGSGVLRADSSGVAEVTASTEEESASVTVTVIQQLRELSLAPNDSTVAPFADLPLRIRGADGAGRPMAISPDELTFSTGDSTIAFVDASGVLHTRWWGTTTISASASGVSDSTNVTSQPEAFSSEGLDLVRIDAGSGQICGLTSSSEPYCRSIAITASWQQVGSGRLFAELHAGAGMACGLSVTNELWCWGSNRNAELGLGVTDPPRSDTAVLVTGGHQWRSFSVGDHKTVCAVTISDEVFCWGHNDNFQVGRSPRGETDSLVAPVTGGLAARSMDVGLFQTCAILTNNQTKCWGLTNLPGTAGAAPGAALVNGLPSLSSVFVADEASCGLDLANSVLCWGQWKSSGAQAATFHAPAAMAPGLRFAKIEVGQSAICGLALDGGLFCWQLGTAEQDAPHRFGGEGESFLDVSIFLNMACALRRDSESFCFTIP
jgi:hypothetical protein